MNQSLEFLSCFLVTQEILRAEFSLSRTIWHVAVHTAAADGNDTILKFATEPLEDLVAVDTVTVFSRKAVAESMVKQDQIGTDLSNHFDNLFSRVASLGDNLKDHTESSFLEGALHGLYEEDIIFDYCNSLHCYSVSEHTLCARLIVGLVPFAFTVLE